MTLTKQYNTGMGILSLSIVYLSILMQIADIHQPNQYALDAVVIAVCIIASVIIYSQKGIVLGLILGIIGIILHSSLYAFARAHHLDFWGLILVFILTMAVYLTYHRIQIILNRASLGRESEQNAKFMELYNQVASQKEIATQKQQFLNMIINSLNPDMLLVTDGNGYVLFANNLFCSTFELDPDAIIGRSIYHVISGTEFPKEHIVTADQEVKKRGTYYFEYEFMRRNGTPISTEIFVTWSSELNTTVILMRDIALRRELENELAHALEDSERDRIVYKTLFDAVQDSLVVYDTEGAQMYRNIAGYKLLDISPQENAINNTDEKQFVQLLTVDGDMILDEINPFTRILQGEAPDPPTNYILKYCDGRQDIVLIDAFPLFYRSKTMLGAAGTIRKVTNEFRDNLYNELLIELTHRCSELMEVNLIAQAAVDVLSEFLHIPNILLSIRNPERPQFIKIIATNIPLDQVGKDELEAIRVLEMTPIAPDAPAQTLRVMATGEPFFDFDPVQLNNANLHYAKYHQAVYMPLSVKGEILGCLNLGTYNEILQWQIPNQGMLMAIVNEIALAIHRAMLYDNVHKMAFFDPLTGVHNHRALQTTLHTILEKACENDQVVSLVMLDVDHFRLFNESYGHDVGDTALKTVASSIQSALREVDFVARYGGEEFTVILPNIEGSAAEQIAERIRQSIESHSVELGLGKDPVKVTASLGLSTYPHHANTAAELLKAADLALYESKHHGRNQVTPFVLSLLNKEDPIPIGKNTDHKQAS